MFTNGYISLWRSILEWEWYDDINTTRLYIHLILTANFKDVEWHGITIKRGSRVASRKTLADETGLTERQIRTAISHLEKTGEVTKLAYSNYTVFTLNNYDKFQNTDQQSTNDRPTVDQQSTKDRPQYNKDNKDKKENNTSLATQDINHNNSYDNIDYGYVPPNKKF